MKECGYDLEYYDHMLRIYSGSAKEICQRRWAWVAQVSPRTVLDYGCGVGWFRAYAPEDVEVDTFDVMPVPQTGIAHEHYDLVTFWDVLEHLPNMRVIEPVIEAAKHVAISIPIMPEGTTWTDWKHFKPGEHLFYPTREQLAAFFDKYGFKEIKAGQPECPPRVDVWNFLYRRANG